MFPSKRNDGAFGERRLKFAMLPQPGRSPLLLNCVSLFR
jgi:hypothetical protein